jgi:hypothetical protein
LGPGYGSEPGMPLSYLHADLGYLPVSASVNLSLAKTDSRVSNVNGVKMNRRRRNESDLLRTTASFPSAWLALAGQPLLAMDKDSSYPWFEVFKLSPFSSLTKEKVPFLLTELPYDVTARLLAAL